VRNTAWVCVYVCVCVRGWVDGWVGVVCMGVWVGGFVYVCECENAGANDNDRRHMHFAMAVVSLSTPANLCARRLSHTHAGVAYLPTVIAFICYVPMSVLLAFVLSYLFSGENVC
jgi:hypothetical protein